jgi:hypothetical protein
MAYGETVFQSSLDLFYTPEILEQVEVTKWSEISCAELPTEYRPATFICQTSERQYIDLVNSYLKLNFKITKAGKDVDGANDRPIPINQALHSVWKQVDLELNGVSVYKEPCHYGYRTYLETLLNSPRTDKDSWLSNEGFYKGDSEDFSRFDRLVKGLVRNSVNKRFALTSNNREAELFGRVRLDFSDDVPLLLDNVIMKLRLWPNKNTFNITRGGARVFEIEFTGVSLQLCTHTVNPETYIAHQKVLQSIPARYPLNNSTIKTLSLVKGVSDFTMPDVFSNRVPEKVIVCMVDTKAFQGSLSSNPFELKHNDITTLGVYVDENSLPAQPMALNFGENRFSEAYTRLYRHAKFRDIDIAHSEFKKGFSIFIFPLLPEGSAIKTGKVKINAIFGTPLTENTTVLVLAQFPSIL